MPSAGFLAHGTKVASFGVPWRKIFYHPLARFDSKSESHEVIIPSLFPDLLA